MITFKTETGNVYEVDLQKKTWKRILATDQSGHIRSINGQFTEISPIIVGKSVRMIMPSLEKGYDFRMLETSRVTSMQEWCEPCNAPQYIHADGEHHCGETG